MTVVSCSLVWTALQEAVQDVEQHQDLLIEALQLLVEIVVWGDQNEPLVSTCFDSHRGARLTGLPC